MEFSLNNKVIEYMEAVHRQSLTHEVTTESIIPDSLPDVQRVIETTGTVCLRSKECDEGRFTVTGEVNITVIYADDEGLVKRTEISLPFSAVEENGNIKSGLSVIASVRIASCDTRLLNPRKLLVRCDILIEAACYGPKKLEVKLPADEDETVQLLTGEHELNVLTEVTEKTFVVREEYTLPPSKPLVGEMLKTNVYLELEEVKGVGNKVILKGSAKANMLYRPEKGGEPVNLEFSTVFSQIMELSGPSDELSFKAFFVPTSIYFDTEALFSAEDRRIVLEAHILAQCLAYRMEKITCIADAYSGKYEISTETEKCDIESMGQSVETAKSVRGTIEVPRQPGNIISVSALPGLVYESREGDKAELKTTVCVCVLYISEDGVLLTANKKISVSAEIMAEAGCNHIVSAFVKKEPAAVISTEGIEIRLDIAFNIRCRKNIEISSISKIEVDTEKPKDISSLPSVVIKRFCQGDTLWQIAKKYSSGRELIFKANGLEEGKEPEINTMLIIPKMR